MNRRAFLLSAGAGAALAAAPRAWAQDLDPAVAQLLEIEVAQLAMYERARGLPLTGRTAALAGRFRNHEAEHLERLSSALRQPPPVKPKFSFGKADEFLRLAQRLEALAVSAYNGAIPAVRDTGLRAELAAIAQTEARHAAAIRELRGRPGAPRPFDPGAPAEAVQQALAAVLE